MSEHRRKRCYIDHIRRPAQEPVGYCWNATHYGMLSKGLLKSHGCLKKKCPYLERYNDSAYEFWNGHKDNMEDKQAGKAVRKLYLDGKISVQLYLEWQRLAKIGEAPSPEALLRAAQRKQSHKKSAKILR